MDKKEEEEKMIAKDNQKNVTVSDETAMNAAKVGMKKYRKALDKLAKN